MFSLSEPSVEALLIFLGGFSFFSGLPSFRVKLLKAALVRFLADVDPLTGDDTSGAVGAAGASITVERKSRAKYAVA